MNPIEETIKDFIFDNFYVRDDTELAGDASLLRQGIVDSTGVLELTAFLEQRFEIRVSDDEILPENLDTLNGIVAFVGRKSASKVA